MIYSAVFPSGISTHYYTINKNTSTPPHNKQKNIHPSKNMSRQATEYREIKPPKLKQLNTTRIRITATDSTGWVSLWSKGAPNQGTSPKRWTQS